MAAFSFLNDAIFILGKINRHSREGVFKNTKILLDKCCGEFPTYINWIIQKTKKKLGKVKKNTDRMYAFFKMVQHTVYYYIFKQLSPS